MKTTLRKARIDEVETVWEILRQAILRRKNDGSNQWQDGYPNLQVVQKDIEQEIGYVLVLNHEIIGYTAILKNNEPQYAKIEGKWLTDGDFIVYHRVAIAPEYVGKNFGSILIEHIEAHARTQNIYSLKADTNHDNHAMLRIFQKNGYAHCGTVYFRGSPRLAYEKVLEPVVK